MTGFVPEDKLSQVTSLGPCFEQNGNNFHFKNLLTEQVF